MTVEAVSIRRAVAENVPAIGHALADAFVGYPWTQWTVAADHHGQRVAALQSLFAGEIALPYGEVWIAEETVAVKGRGAARMVGAASWLRPDSDVPPQAWTALAPRAAELAGDRHAYNEAAEAASGVLRPKESHYYLAVVGVVRSHQGRGIAGRLLRPTCDAATAHGIAAYLETSTPANVAFYEHLGFGVIGETDAPGDGPHVWGMLRP